MRRDVLLSCVTITTVCPWRCSSAKTPMISLLVVESRFPVGSRRGECWARSPARAAMATRWRWPPDSSLGLWSIRSPRRRAGAHGRALAPPARRHAGVDQRQLDVVQRVGARQQVERLEDEPDFLVPDAGQLIVSQIADLLPVKPVLAARRRIEAGR